MNNNEVKSDTSDEECNIESNNATPIMTNISDCISDCNNENNLWTDLQMLIINYNIPHGTANELLRILKNHGLLELPNDVRTLLRMPRNVCMRIKSVANGRYIHFDFSSSLEVRTEILHL